MMRDLVHEVLKATSPPSPQFALEKIVMDKSCMLTIEWPVHRFSVKIMNDASIVVDTLQEAAALFSIALCDSGVQTTRVRVMHRRSLRTWTKIGVVYFSGDSKLDTLLVRDWIIQYLLRKHYSSSEGIHSEEESDSSTVPPMRQALTQSKGTLDSKVSGSSKDTPFGKLAAAPSS